MDSLKVDVTGNLKGGSRALQMAAYINEPFEALQRQSDGVTNMRYCSSRIHHPEGNWEAKMPNYHDIYLLSISQLIYIQTFVINSTDI